MSASSKNTPSLSILDTTHPHTFIPPLKKINEGHDVSNFLVSKAYGNIMTFLLQLNRAMFPCSIKINANKDRPKKVQIWELGPSESVFVSDSVKELQNLLKKLDAIIDEIPPDPGPRRFGNASFRKWYEVVESRTEDLLSSHLPPITLSFPHTSSEITSKSEISSYFLGSFGSAQRLDYGSGHELSFLAFLGCIWKLGGFKSSSEPEQPPSPPGNTSRAIVLHIINPYLQLIRRLIKTYTLEPAGSHGVWGLDDHSFIPYIFGSAQYGPPISPEDPTPLEGSRDSAPKPGDVAKIAAVNRERDKNMYFGAIGFIHDVKKGPFWEHSPMLYDISGVPHGWGKINKGMIKMYSAEVLSKFPVVQHFPFGSLFSFDPDSNATTAPPKPSIHTSSQPIRDHVSSGVSLENASARGLPPPPPEGTTRAPWANRGIPTDSGSRIPPAMRTRFPLSSTKTATREPLPVRVQKPPDVNDDDRSGVPSMPPPTRAPWAKPP